MDETRLAATHVEPMTIKDFVDAGLVGVINAVLLWPRGIALAYTMRTTGDIDEKAGLRLCQIVPPDTITDHDTDGTLACSIQSLARWDAQRQLLIEQHHARRRDPDAKVRRQ